MSGAQDSHENLVDVGGGDVPVTSEDLKLFEKPDSSSLPERSADQQKDPPVGVKPERDQDDEGSGTGDDRFSQSQNRLRRERQRQARDRTQQELQALRAQVAHLTQAVSQGQLGTVGAAVESLDAQFTQVRAQFQDAERRYSMAITNGDGPAATQALADRDSALEKARDIENKRGQASRAAQQIQARGQQQDPRQPQGRQPAAAPEVDPEVADHGLVFMRDHSWYELNGTDRDSQMVHFIDTRLANQGYDPRTPEYWTELRNQVKEMLPHRFTGNGASSGSQPARRGPPMAGPGGGQSRQETRDPLAAHRVEALKQAGMWDDPELRARGIKSYRDYDAQHRNGGDR